MRRIILLTLLLTMLLTGCGYTLQNSKDSSLLKEGVHKIYVQPLVNNTYKPGVENLVYNQLVRSISASGRVQMVSRREDADAVLGGSVGSASYTSIAGSAVSSLTPVGLGTGLPTQDFQIPAQYNANLSCDFYLSWVHTPAGRDSMIWSGGFTRSFPFPGANQLDVPGTTSSLINESEFERTLLDIAKGMMVEVNNSMLAMF